MLLLLFLPLSLAVLVLGVFSAYLPLAFSADAKLAISVQPARTPQGSAVFLLIDAPGATAVQVRDGASALPAELRADGRWEAVAAVPMDAQPGSHVMRVEAKVDGGTTVRTTSVVVTARTFPIQRLRMSRAQDKQYEAPGTQEEYRLIGAALATRTPRYWHGAFRLPVTGRLATRYGVRRYRNGKRVGTHKGIDLAAPTGTLVRAAAAGTIVLKRSFALHGNTLVVDHGSGVVGLYLHLRDFSVDVGDVVQAGQPIAHVGATGVATGPHLHYALYIHGTPVDPLLWQQVPDGW